MSHSEAARFQEACTNTNVFAQSGLIIPKETERRIREIMSRAKDAKEIKLWQNEARLHDLLGMDFVTVAHYRKQMALLEDVLNEDKRDDSFDSSSDEEPKIQSPKQLPAEIVHYDLVERTTDDDIFCKDYFEQMEQLCALVRHKFDTMDSFITN